MKQRIITEERIRAFLRELWENEKSPRTMEKYARDLRRFAAYAGECRINKETVLAYKEHIGESFAVSSANATLAALNGFFRFLGWSDLCVRQFKMQRKVFCPEERELKKEEYLRLVRAAEKAGNERIALVLQTICGTGIRVSELAAVTVEAVKRGEAVVSCKGKTRTVFLVAPLCKKLLRYVKERRIQSGPVFVTRSGRALDRSNIWREMKALCRAAQVNPHKVFPHNLRHLFARTFYQMERDIARLADILGHSSINTTRIYMMSCGAEHRRRMEQMRLVS